MLFPGFAVKMHDWHFLLLQIVLHVLPISVFFHRNNIIKILSIQFSLLK